VTRERWPLPRVEPLPPPAGGGRPPCPLSVAVVDDDASVCRALGRLLRAAGYAAQTFASAEEFLRRQDQGQGQGRPDCLVLDVQLPGLSGLDLQKSLATAGDSLPIVFITGASDPAARVQALANGAAGFLLKPIDGVALLDAVSRATTQGRAPDRGAAGWPGSPP
jgi:FixJ family two-component response regulator